MKIPRTETKPSNRWKEVLWVTLLGVTAVSLAACLMKAIFKNLV